MIKQLVLFYLIVIVAAIGCGERENRDILYARKAIARGDFAKAEIAVGKAISNDPTLIEAKLLKQILETKDLTDVTKWENLAQSLTQIESINSEIDQLEKMEDPDSDDLNRLEILARSRNSIVGTFVVLLGEKSLHPPPSQELIDLLLEADKSYFPTARSSAEKLLDQIGDRATQQLLKATKEPDPLIRKTAVRQIGDLRDVQFIDDFSAMLQNKSESPQVLYEVIVALEKIKTEPILPALKIATRSNSALVRMRSAKLIGELRNADAVGDLVRLLADTDNYVKNQAIASLLQIGIRSVTPVIEVLNRDAMNILPDPTPEFMAEFQFIANAYIDQDRLESRRRSAISAAITTLADLHATSAIPKTIKLLDDDHLRGTAKTALTTFGKSALSDLLSTMKNRQNSDEMRIASAEILSGIDDPKLVDLFLDALENEQLKEIRAIAITALGKLTHAEVDAELREKTITAISELITDDSLGTHAINAIGVINDNATYFESLGKNAAAGKLGGVFSIRNRSAYWLSIHGNVRFSDLTTLKISDVWQNGSAVNSLKTASSETLDLNADAQSAIQNVIDWHKTHYGSIDENRILFPSRIGNNPLTVDRLRSIFATAFNDAAQNGTLAGRSFRKNDDEKIIDRVAVEPLIRVAENRRLRQTTRQAALATLAKIKPASALQPMLRITINDSTSDDLRKAALIVLAGLKDDHCVPTLEWILRSRFDTIKKFHRHLRRTYKVINDLNAEIDHLNIEWNADYPKPFYRSWGEVKPIPSLVRSEATTTLRKIRAERSADLLVEVLAEDERATVRKNAAFNLGEQKVETTSTALIEALKDDDQGVVRRECAIAIGKFAATKAISPLIDRMTKDEYEAVRIKSAIALRHVNTPRVESAMIDVLKLGEGSFDQKKETAEVRGEIMTSVKDGGSVETIKKLISARGSRSAKIDDSVRWSIVHCLGEIAKPEGLDAIIDLTHDENFNIRKKSVIMLRKFNDPKSISKLVEIVSDESRSRSKTIRALAIESLGELKTEPNLIITALNDASGEVREKAVIALGKMVVMEAVDPLILRLEDPLEIPIIREVIIEALGKIDGKTAEDATERIAINERGTVYEKAIIALGGQK